MRRTLGLAVAVANLVGGGTAFALVTSNTAVDSHHADTSLAVAPDAATSLVADLTSVAGLGDLSSIAGILDVAPGITGALDVLPGVAGALDVVPGVTSSAASPLAVVNGAVPAASGIAKGVTQQVSGLSDVVTSLPGVSAITDLTSVAGGLVESLPLPQIPLPTACGLASGQTGLPLDVPMLGSVTGTVGSLTGTVTSLLGGVTGTANVAAPSVSNILGMVSGLVGEVEGTVEGTTNLPLGATGLVEGQTGCLTSMLP